MAQFDLLGTRAEKGRTTHQEPKRPAVTSEIINIIAPVFIVAVIGFFLEYRGGGVQSETLSRLAMLIGTPSMNAEMWANPITQDNVKRLKELTGYTFIGPEEGWQACRTRGVGRMSEPETIVDRLRETLVPE